MSRRVLLLSLLAVAACSKPEAGPDQAAAAVDSALITVTGFATPESVLYDGAADVYLVSNINGGPASKDDNGFISRVAPDGRIEQLKWIDGADSAVTLHAPKGTAIRGDTLYVADIDCVRRFVRTTGKAAGEICFKGASFLNDLATDANGTLYVTDTGVDSTFKATGTDAVWRFTPDGSQTGKVIEGSVLGGPNGIAFRGQDGFVVTFGSGEIYQIGPNNNRNIVLPGAADRALDGIVFTKDGGYLFSSWGDSAVHRVTPAGATSRELEGLEGPADIGYDEKRDRVLVPVFNKNEVVIKRLGAASGAEPAGAH